MPLTLNPLQFHITFKVQNLFISEHFEEKKFHRQSVLHDSHISFSQVCLSPIIQVPSLTHKNSSETSLKVRQVN